MNEDVVEAVGLGQKLCLQCSDTHQLECLELAMDELLRHPHRAGTPRDLLDAALAHSRTHLRRRRAIRTIVIASDHLSTSDCGGGERADEEHRTVLEFEDWVHRSALGKDQRLLLLCQVHEIDVPAIAQAFSVPAPRIRERLARARAAARSCRAGV